MGVWLVSADVLAASRFVTSPLVETVNALGVLASRNPQLWERDWLARHSQAFRERIKADPFSTAMAQAVQSGSWLPVDLSVPPRPGDVTFEQELARVRAVSPQTAKFDLTQGTRRPLPDAFDVSDPAGAFADLVQWTWGSHRSGAHVLYNRTPTGQQLLRSAGPGSQPSRPADLARNGPSNQGVTWWRKWRRRGASRKRLRRRHALGGRATRSSALFNE